ncbi:MAG: orotidine-5'-phosphate decarboxylase [Candidatus Abyssobacteria bacterium SURF_17]|jgi:orotidine-5'-phosphate decarboxylase|uniref:Orotidine 5'-phosphate decarboxylase n=1 Tax=Candidatus Abyssobacteria bacterium SURF_17 TaxID=2093361 RepID=A0A419F9W0_9BACT|nr:MAG: orotidine-5'-phosphate decarboxylase [Candidatus Abyssubacteria bacterium SURF_17]
MSLTPKERLIVALDYPSAEQALKFVEQMGDSVIFYKVGLELFSAAGPDIVTRLKSLGKAVFLDMKFHDIPNTVAGAAARAVAMGADIFNVHALGGMAMMRAAAAAASEAASRLGVKRPTVLAVTVLTSMDREALEREAGIHVGEGIGTFVAAKARQAKEAGLDGVVASPHEVSDVRSVCGNDFEIITPGVRPAWASSDDQKRVATPFEALKMGADRIVIGRPITRAKNPHEAVERILAEIG